MEKIEELLGEVESWAAETGQLLGKISHEGTVEPETKEHLQVKMEIHCLKYLLIKFIAGVK